MPYIDDVFVLKEMLEHIGARVELPGESRMIIDPSEADGTHAPFELATRMRASYYLISVMLGRMGKGTIARPGGCDIGPRPIDQSIKAWRALGADVDTSRGDIEAHADELRGGEVFLDTPSVGATINAMLTAVLARGRTIIVNAAREPHVVDAANFLGAMGASIKGAGTDVIRIQGVKTLHGCNYTIIPDQIETGTLMLAAAASQGDVTIRGVIPIHMEALSSKMMEMGVSIIEGEDFVRVVGVSRPRPANIKTLVYPGFPTDLQAQAATYLSVAQGTSIITETVSESRFKYIDEIRRMGARAAILDRVAMVEGVERLSGAHVTASDLRAGAALIIAGLMAEGETHIYNTHYTDRGYERIEEKLANLGAQITRAPAERRVY